MLKYLTTILISAIAVITAVSGCGPNNGAKPDTQAEHLEDEHAGNSHAEEATFITGWQDSLEIFAELFDMRVGESVKIVAYVTDITTNKAVDHGVLAAVLKRGDTAVQRTSASAPTRPGIYNLSILAPAAGEYELVFSLTRDERVQSVTFDDFDVHGLNADSHAGHDHSGHDHEHEGEHAHESDMATNAGHDEHGGESSGDAVTLTKEQQWQIDFATKPVMRRTISDNIRALGEIKAAGVGEAEVFAPFDGVLMPDPEHGIVRPGQQVSKGEVLAHIAPSGGPESGWTQLLNDYRLARAEYERVSRLADEGAVSAKRREEARLDLENKRSRVRGALGGTDSDVDEVLATGDHFHLRAPASGVITDIHLRFGQHVETGEHLFNIIDPTRIWLEVQVPISESDKLDDVTDAVFTLSGSDEIHRVSDLGGHLVTVSRLLDPATRRVPVIFELRNQKSMFRPGSFAQVYLKTQSAREALAIPESAILNEDGTPVVYVQTGGESFVRRVIQTGAKDEGFLEIRDGIAEGERVVVTGAYKVRLASLKVNAADAGHAGHAH